MTQPQKPSVDLGRRKNPVVSPHSASAASASSAMTSGGSRTVAIRPLPRIELEVSFQRIQVGNEAVNLGRGQVEVRHDRAGFLGGWIGQPGTEIVVSVLEDGAGEHAAALEV